MRTTPTSIIAMRTEIGANSAAVGQGPPASAPTAVGFWEAFSYWLKLGCISFGGPAGQIAIMHDELVVRRRWISERRFLHALNYCMVLPGPEARQLATYLGWLMHRTRGGIAAGVLFVLPSLFILLGLSWVYVTFGNVPLIAGLFYGIKPAVVAIVLQAAHRMGSRVLKHALLWLVAAASFLAILVFKVPFPVIVLLAALTGVVGARLAPQVFRVGAAHGASADSSGPALIDDDTPTPAHARFQWSRLMRVFGVGALLWLIPMAALLLSYGWHGTLTQMGWFFTKAALLTFGGAYAVLPYVFQGAVEQYGWLTAAQMMDGLALGETTPGPLIMVVAFVAFVGGHTHELLAAGGAATPQALFLAGVAAAVVVTWFTFLPSFLFILAGGPFVESTRGDLKFSAPLTAITAAVVGVVLNLALFFGYHALWPSGLGSGGFSGRFDWVCAVLVLLAATALLRFKRNVIEVLAACAVAGLLVQTLA